MVTSHDTTRDGRRFTGFLQSKTSRFGLNWVVLGVAVPIPFRADRYFCLPVLWWLYRKEGQPGHKPRPQSAAELARRLAEANPERTSWLVGDRAWCQGWRRYRFPVDGYPAPRLSRG